MASSQQWCRRSARTSAVMFVFLTALLLNQGVMGDRHGSPGALSEGYRSRRVKARRRTEGDNVGPTFATNSTFQVGTHDHVSIGGRKFILHIPEGITEPAPAVVFDFHGLFLNSFVQMQFSGMKQLSDKHKNFIVVWVQGIGGRPIVNAFNSDLCCGSEANRAGVDDVADTLEIIQHIKDNMVINPRRIYSYGYSQGGALSSYFAWEASNVFAAVAPNAFTMDLRYYEAARSVKDSGRNVRHMPVFIVDGYNDRTHNSYSNHDGFRYWADINDCIGDPVTLEEKPTHAFSFMNSDHDEFKFIKEYQNCGSGVVVAQLLSSANHMGEWFGKHGMLFQSLKTKHVIDFFFRWTLPDSVDVTEPSWWSDFD